MRRVLMAFIYVSIFYGLGLTALSAQTGHTQPAMAGKLIAIHPTSLSIRTAEGVRTILVSGETKIWRGREVDINQLKVGDYLGVRYHAQHNGAPMAESIDANVDRWGGIITKVGPSRVEVAISSDEQGPTGIATITFDTSTEFVHRSLQDRRVGRHIEVIGLVLKKHKMLATRVLGLELEASR